MKLPFLRDIGTIQAPEKPVHVHVWELIAKTFVEPRQMTVANNDDLTRLALTGITTYLFQCSTCSECKTEELPGLEETSLDGLLNKVDVGGPEFIIRGTKTYILMKHPDQPQQGIPLRK